MVIWDDKSVKDFLTDYGYHSSKLGRICAAASKRIQFEEVPIEDIVLKCDVEDKGYDIFPKRVMMWQRRFRQGQPIGTLFCRPHKDKWFVKDGNHRFIALRAEGVKVFRIAYDPKDKV